MGMAIVRNNFRIVFSYLCHSRLLDSSIIYKTTLIQKKNYCKIELDINYPKICALLFHHMYGDLSLADRVHGSM